MNLEPFHISSEEIMETMRQANAARARKQKNRWHIIPAIVKFLTRIVELLARIPRFCLGFALGIVCYWPFVRAIVWSAMMLCKMCGVVYGDVPAYTLFPDKLRIF